LLAESAVKVLTESINGLTDKFGSLADTILEGVEDALRDEHRVPRK